MTSILACLQAPINISKIKKQIEATFLNAKKRSAGLKIIAKLLTYSALPSQQRLDIISWFASGLRGNKNELSHYLDGLKGCGAQLEEQIGTNFFGIIRTLVNQLRDEKSLSNTEIKAIINSLRWSYVGKDHAPMKCLELMRTLYEGNNLAVD